MITTLLHLFVRALWFLPVYLFWLGLVWLGAFVMCDLYSFVSLRLSYQLAFGLPASMLHVHFGLLLARFSVLGSILTPTAAQERNIQHKSGFVGRTWSFFVENFSEHVSRFVFQ